LLAVGLREGVAATGEPRTLHVLETEVDAVRVEAEAFREEGSEFGRQLTVLVWRNHANAAQPAGGTSAHLAAHTHACRVVHSYHYILRVYVCATNQRSEIVG
jgi:hypothetical protein